MHARACLRFDRVKRPRSPPCRGRTTSSTFWEQETILTIELVVLGPQSCITDATNAANALGAWSLACRRRRSDIPDNISAAEKHDRYKTRLILMLI